MSHTHLDKIKAVNLGSFYTPTFIVQIAQQMLLNALKIAHISPKDCALLDSSCGYGNFLDFDNCDKAIKNLSDFTDFALKIGIDIDKKAIDIATKAINTPKNPPLFIHQNALLSVNRKTFKIPLNAPLAIIGNPPYNDKTSIVQKHIKDKTYALDSALKHRDIGASFLLSFVELQADFICVLHPLSYLIKETNFKSLKRFFTQYALIDSLIISSQIFCPNSTSFFPIIIALYEKKSNALDFANIKNHTFKTIEGKSFALNGFDFIGRYIDKYPNKSRVSDKDRIALFYTLRDINALRRSKTFLDKPTTNAINVPQEKYSLYCYVDVFKQMIRRVPYYLGNCDILIDFVAFKALEGEFVKCAKSKIITPKITRYFENLLGEHYENS